MIPFLTFWGKRRWATGRGMICVRRWCLASLSLCNDVGYVFLHPWWLLICWCLWHAIELLIALKRKSRQCFQRLYCFRCLVMQRGSAFNGCIAFLASGGSLFSSQCIQQKMTLYIGIGWIGWERWLSQKKKDVTSFFEQHDEASKKDVTSIYFWESHLSQKHKNRLVIFLKDGDVDISRLWDRDISQIEVGYKWAKSDCASS